MTKTQADLFFKVDIPFYGSCSMFLPVSPSADQDDFKMSNMIRCHWLSLV